MRKDNARRPGAKPAASRPRPAAEPAPGNPNPDEARHEVRPAPRPAAKRATETGSATRPTRKTSSTSSTSHASASSSSRSTSPKKPKTATSRPNSRTPKAAQPGAGTETGPLENGENWAGTSERLQKLIAQSGLVSRRAAELLILEGRVSVNGHIVTELGAKADALNDNIVVDGKPLKPPGAPVVLLLHKPKGYMTTRHDPEGRPTVMDLLPKKFQHLHPIGRLDFETAGVLLLTNDGELTNLLTHPSHGVTKTYWARVQGQPKKEALQKLAHGITLEDGPTAPCQVRLRAESEKNALVEVVLREGRNRQVRRMLEAVGYPVRALRRVAFGNLDLEGLPVGEFRELLPTEVRHLRKIAEPTSSKDRADKAKTTQAKVRMPKPRANRPSPTAEKPTPRSDNPKLGFNRPRPNSRADRPKSVKPRTEKPRVERPKSEQPGAERPTSGRRDSTEKPQRDSTKATHPLARKIKRAWEE